jgi:hypothetical protein
VNYLVVRYEETIREKIVLAEAAVELKQKDSHWKKAYTAWYEQIQARVMPKLLPWYTAVSSILDTKMSDLHCDQLPLPGHCTYAHGCPWAGSSQQVSVRRFQSIPDVIRHWSDTRERTEHWDTKVIHEPFTLHNGTVDLARFTMIWSFAPVQERYSNFHSLTFDVDARPSGIPLELIEEEMEVQRELNLARHEVFQLKNEIIEDNIKNLERRALARMTAQALGQQQIECLPL